MTASLDKQQIFDTLPQVWPEPLLPQIRERVAADPRRFVILDDDPTGGQTLHSLPVLGTWDTQTMAREAGKSAAFFVLTNSRALRESEAVALAAEVGRNLRAVQKQTGRSLIAGYRGDSTLRGHFPAETDALHAALTGSDDLPTYVFVPYFGEGGRFTLNDTQYVLQGDRLVPAAETEFGRDPRFGYRHSHLPAWIEERSAGRIRAADVVSVSIDDVRTGGPDAVTARLGTVHPGGAVIVNAAEERDIEVFVAGLLDAEAAGSRFLYRTSASFVRVRAGIDSRPLLTGAELRTERGPGLVLVGSHVDRTTQQLEGLLQLPGVVAKPLDVQSLLLDTHAESRRATLAVSAALVAGHDTVLYTTRELLTSTAGLDAVAIGERITAAFCAVLRGLEQRPGFLVVKGGSTAHGVALQGLGMRRSVVLGQLLAGVPVWQLGPESRYPNLPYVVFPGNIGDGSALARAVTMLRGGIDAGQR